VELRDAPVLFHIDDHLTAQDDVGVELESLAAAKCEGVKLAGQHICDASGTFWDTGEWSLTASDESGLTLFTLHFLGMEAPVLRAEAIADAGQPVLVAEAPVPAMVAR
jgi:hypothetical protein